MIIQSDQSALHEAWAGTVRQATQKAGLDLEPAAFATCVDTIVAYVQEETDRGLYVKPALPVAEKYLKAYVARSHCMVV